MHRADHDQTTRDDDTITGKRVRKRKWFGMWSRRNVERIPHIRFWGLTKFCHGAWVGAISGTNNDFGR
jgi:hypothetical protein